MKYLNLICLVSAVCASYVGPTSTEVKEEVVKGSYIVTLKDELRSNSLDSHLDVVKSLFKTKSDSNIINYVYRNLGNRSYSAKLSLDVVEKVKDLPEVKSVVNNMVVRIDSSTLQSNAPWGLSRISRRTKIPSVKFDRNIYNYTYNGDGSGVTVYSIDSGIKLNHPEFEGRAFFGKNYSPSQDTDDDENGHGTHTSGTMGSKTYGVAKKVKLVAVKVFDKVGNSNWAAILAALDWVIQDTTFKSEKGNVINMSLGGPKSQEIDAAVELAYSKGIVVVVSAGNDNKDACLKSPASVPNAITVGAIDTRDTRASFSNYGKCVDIFAPGYYIMSASVETEIETLSGTSMAAPHVAGLAAYILSNNSEIAPAQVTQKILELATKDVLLKIGDESPNLLAYNGIVQ